MTKKLLPSKGKGVPPSAVVPETNNLVKKDPGSFKQINFQLTKAKKLEMITYAGEHDISLTDLLVMGFDAYKASNP